MAFFHGKGKNMMNSETVYKMAAELQAAKLNESKNDVIPETEVKDEVQPGVVETNDATPENENVSDDTPAQETVVESAVGNTEGTDSKKLKPSKAEQEKYAFTKLKNKERQKREKLIADYESKIKSLNDELSRFKGLDKNNFKTDDEYFDYKLSQKLKEQEAGRLQAAKTQMEAEQFEEINQQRIMNCFPDEKDREIYNKLIETSAPQFVELLDKADPDGAILSYLDDSDIAPMLIRIMMTKPEYRNEILSKKNPYSKIMALDNLAKQVTYAKSVIDKKRSSKKPMPVVGKVAKSENSSSLDKSSPDYWNERLKQLNALRGRR